MTRTEKFIKEIESIQGQLNTLENEYVELYKAYDGNTFDGQPSYASEIENLTLLLTHELSSQIGFGISNLQIRIKFIDFRKKYREFNNEELLNIIDKTTTSKDKLKLLKDKKTQNTNEVRAEWNTVFKNTSYEKICKKLLPINSLR